MTSYITPAEHVIKIFGGVRATARKIGRAPASVSNWKNPRSRKGCGGKIPGRAAEIILRIAEKEHLDIRPSDILLGRKRR